MKTSLHGLIAATHTPFHSDGTLNLAVVEQQATFLAQRGVGTVFIGGSTGESHSLSLNERLALAERWLNVVRGAALKVVVHVGSNCIVDAKALAKQAEELGALAISALAPSYFKPRTLNDLIACVAEIAAAAPQSPFYFYDIPSMTGVNFSMPEFLSVASERIPTLAGIKFTNPDLMSYQLCLRVSNRRYDIPWGCDEYMLTALALGAQGAVGSSYNFAAPIYQRLWQAFSRGDLDTAREEQFRSVQLIQLLGSQGYMGAAKSVMKMLGVDVGPPRRPNTALSHEQVHQLRHQLETLGFFDWVSIQ